MKLCSSSFRAPCTSPPRFSPPQDVTPEDRAEQAAASALAEAVANMDHPFTWDDVQQKAEARANLCVYLSSRERRCFVGSSWC